MCGVWSVCVCVCSIYICTCECIYTNVNMYIAVRGLCGFSVGWLVLSMCVRRFVLFWGLLSFVCSLFVDTGSLAEPGDHRLSHIG